MARTILEKDDLIPLLAEVFRTHGYDGTSIGLIVKATGAGRSSLYHFFPGGKEEMAEAVLDHISSWFERNIFTPLETLPPAEALAQMEAAVTDYFHSGRRICLVGAFALDETGRLFERRIRSYFERWLTSLAACLTRAGAAPPAAAQDAFRIVAAIQGAIVLSRATASRETFGEILRNALPGAAAPRR